MSIVWNKYPETKPEKPGPYLVFSSDDYKPGYMIKTRIWGMHSGWEYGDNFITHWAEYPNTPTFTLPNIN
ncbi:MAG: hypothetical protein J6J74_06065 [Elusimicrobiaceae bacterium]|nr:hypothetical protein [Elusimicrobiaceae bacterium]